MTKKGFTLSEVLIAMVIMGVLAAILIPMVQRTAPNKSIVMYKKAYNSLLTAVVNMINDDNNYSASNVNTNLNNMQIGFQYTALTATPTYYSTLKFCYLLMDQLNTVGSSFCPADTSTGQGFFTTSDGAFWTVYIPVDDVTNYTTYVSTNAASSATSGQFPVSITAPLYPTKVIIDVNGPTVGTNCSADTGFSGVGTIIPSPFAALGITPSPTYAKCAVTTSCASNPDTFVVGVRFDGKIQVGSGASTDACANYILNNPTSNN